MTTSEIISLCAMITGFCSVIVVLYFNRRNLSRNETSDASKQAADMAVLNVKLDNISRGVDDIRYDVSGVKKDIEQLKEDLIKVDGKAKSAHSRIDDLVKKEGYRRET